MTLKTRTATLCIDSTGAISDSQSAAAMFSPPDSVAAPEPRVNGEFHAANHATWNAARERLTLDYDAIGARAVVAVARNQPT